MKKMTHYRSRNGYPWTIIERRGDIALAYGGSIGFEVFEVQRHDGREIGGKWCEPAEYAPSNEQWGSKGWSFSNEKSARAKFDELTAVIA
jgi:hypothetical protein